MKVENYVANSRQRRLEKFGGALIQTEQRFQDTTFEPKTEYLIWIIRKIPLPACDTWAAGPSIRNDA